MQKIKLGQKVRDIITGFEGITTARVEYINGCVQFGVKPKIKEDGKQTSCEYIDVEQLEIVKDQKSSMGKSETGGPQADCPSH